MRFLSRLLTTSVAASLLFAPFQVIAKADFLQLSLQELMAVQVTSASRTPESILEAPATIRVIKRAQIQQRGYRKLSDILQDTIGFDFADASDSPYFNRFGVRGIFGNNKFLILQDGVRISSPTGEVTTIADNYPLYMVEQVEILFGPASALYGADALTAVINLITRKDTDTYGELLVDGGQNDFGHIQLLGQWANEDFALRLGVHKQQLDYNSLTNDYSSQYTLGDLVTFSGQSYLTAEQRLPPDLATESESLDFRMTIKDSFSIGRIQRSFTHSTATANLPNFVDYGPQPFWQTEQSIDYIKYQHSLGKSWTTELSYNENRYEISPSTSFANIFVNFEQGYKYTKSSRSTFSQLFKRKLGNKHKLTLGYDWEKLDSIPLTPDLPSPYQTNTAYNLQNLYFANTNEKIQVPIFHSRWKSYSYFAQLQSQINSDFSTTFGLRYDKSSIHESSLNPRLSLVYQPAQDLALKISYGEAFFAPSPENRFRLFGSFSSQNDQGLYPSTFFQLPNENLEAEKLRTLEFGWTQLFSAQWMLQADIYFNELESIIQPTFNEPPLSGYFVGGDIAFTQTNNNSGKLNSHGFDATLTYQAEQSALGSLNTWLNLSYVDGTKRNLNQETQLPYTSGEKVRLGATWQYQGWEISPVIRWQSESTLSEQDSALSKMTKDFSVVDLFIQRKNLLPRLDLYLDINNLLNNSYGVAGEGSDTTFEQVPQLKRWSSLGIRYRF